MAKQFDFRNVQNPASVESVVMALHVVSHLYDNYPAVIEGCVSDVRFRKDFISCLDDMLVCLGKRLVNIGPSSEKMNGG